MNRRTFIATATAATSATGLAAAHTADPHGAWLARWRKLRDAINDHPTGDGAEVEAIEAERSGIEDRLIATEARTLEGIRAQVEWLKEDADGFWCCDDHRRVTARILRALEGIA
ncbi:hypothetical protein LVO79_21065 (plasmid) [Roseivivax marinus]|uniref:hypothetical protein n=1 Tax=Roseivivax marinus TaxID=1379903 RepID=UPI001F0402C4|nr:hypothetical protein [Roseivivax marinus]UMA67291.1 hypothetical protein LVO79_21065 [Roseivivax marinus]